MESNLLYSKFSDLNVQFNSVAQLFLKRSSPGSSAGKESACNAGDPSSIPGLGRSPVEGIGYPLQYSLVSLVAQTVKNLPVMWGPGFSP